MIKDPEYSEDIIVLIRYNNDYSWYLSEKTIWVMDYFKWAETFGTAMDGLDVIKEREGLEVLSKDNWPTFKERNFSLETSKAELRDLVRRNLPIVNWDEKSELFPALFLDFDKSILYSLFPETLEFEKYVSEDWTGLYEDFYFLIPDVEKYWIIDGMDYLPKV